MGTNVGVIAGCQRLNIYEARLPFPWSDLHDITSTFIARLQNNGALSFVYFDFLDLSLSQSEDLKENISTATLSFKRSQASLDGDRK